MCVVDQTTQGGLSSGLGTGDDLPFGAVKVEVYFTRRGVLEDQNP